MLRKKSKSKKMKKMLARYRNSPSSIEVTFEKILQELGILYEKQWRVPYKKTYKYYDFLVFEKNEHDETLWRFACEVNGDFFHAFEYHCGNKKKEELFKIQRKNLRNDSTKSKLLKSLEVPLFVYWEHQIKNNKKLVSENLKRVIQHFKDLIKNRKSIVLLESEVKELNKI